MSRGKLGHEMGGTRPTIPRALLAQIHGSFAEERERRREAVSAEAAGLDYHCVYARKYVKMCSRMCGGAENVLVFCG